MKGKSVKIGLGILITAGVFTGVVLAQKAEIVDPQDAQVLTMSNEDGPQMFYFNGSEGAWLGVSVADVTAEQAKELKLPGEYGAVVKEVRPDSPAAKAGLEKGDVILQFAGEKVRSVAELRRLVRETPPGRKVTLEVSRGGGTQTLTAEIAETSHEKWNTHFEMPHVEVPDVHIPNFNFNLMMGGPRLGISGQDLTTQLASYFGVWQNKGVLVTEVADGSPAQKAGLKAGDVIIKVGAEAIGSVAELREALRKSSETKYKVTLTLVRDRKEQTLNVQLEPPSQLVNPQRIAELKDLGMNEQDRMRLKAEVMAQTKAAMAQAKALQKNSELMRLQKEKIRQEVDRAMKDHQKEMDQLRKELQQLRLEGSHETL